MVQAVIGLSPSLISATPITPRTPGQAAHNLELNSLRSATQAVASAYDGDKPLGKMMSLKGHSQIITLKSAHENTVVGKSFSENFASL